jgi:Ribbon-helix-helix protein, copG family
VARRVCIIGSIKRIQIHIDEALNDAAEAEATRRGQSKAALIREALANELAFDAKPSNDPWAAMTGWLDGGAVQDLDAVIYERKR